MIVSGKCPPTEEELAASADRGFDYVELYLTPQHLDQFEETVSTCRDAEVEVTSVHTPHIDMETLDYAKKADTLAEKFDARLVFHTYKLPLTFVPRILDAMEFSADYGFEHQAGDSLYHVKQVLAEADQPIVLDTAHLYTGEENYLDALEELLLTYGEQIRVVHLCDGTRTEDGLPFGEGTMDMEAVSRIVASYYDGPVVLEVMPKHQGEARKAFEQFTRSLPSEE